MSIADLKPQKPRTPTVVNVEMVVDGLRAQALLKLYFEELSPLNAVSATEQTYTEEEFLWCLAHPSFYKVTAWDGDEPVGLGILTNDLTLVNDPSPQFFAGMYPEHAARDAIFYAMAILVKSSERGTGVFGQLYLEFWQIPAKVNGVLAMDICQFNVETLKTDRIMNAVAANFPECTWREVDRVTWYVVELPKPLP